LIPVFGTANPYAMFMDGLSTGHKQHTLRLYFPAYSLSYCQMAYMDWVKGSAKDSQALAAI